MKEERSDGHIQHVEFTSYFSLYCSPTVRVIGANLFSVWGRCATDFRLLYGYTRSLHVRTFVPVSHRIPVVDNHVHPSSANSPSRPDVICTSRPSERVLKMRSSPHRQCSTEFGEFQRTTRGKNEREGRGQSAKTLPRKWGIPFCS
jgi:hypothetical protein